MTDEQAKALGLRAVGAEFQWAPGCLAFSSATGPVRVLCDSTGEGGVNYVVRPGPDGNEVHAPRDFAVMGAFPRPAGGAFPFWPNLRDAATLGVLLAQVRKALGDPQAYVAPVWNKAALATSRWSVCRSHNRDNRGVCIAEADSEAEALVSALEWAKGRAS